MSSKKPRKGSSIYKTVNWQEYNTGLRKRGSITFWLSDEAISEWHPCPETKLSGGQKLYSDIAIQACLTMRLLYRMLLRQTEGFMNSIFELLKLDIISPDYTTLSRRSENIEIIRELANREGPIDVLIDSTGLKICGSGEWEEAKHGKGRRKVWRKLHLCFF